MQKHILLSLIMMPLLSCYANAQESPEAKKVLIAYFSRSGNTQEIANQIQAITGGDIFEIQLATPYPEDYQACVDQAKKEIESGYKPELKEKIKNIESYDVIFIGTPNWWSTIAPPVTTFLSELDLSGKTVVPFCTHGGGGKAGCFTDIEKLCPKSTVLDGLAVSGGNAKNAKTNVEKWLREIKIVK